MVDLASGSRQPWDRHSSCLATASGGRRVQSPGRSCSLAFAPGFNVAATQEHGVPRKLKLIPRGLSSYLGGSSIHQRDASFYLRGPSIHQKDSSFYPGGSSIYQKDSSFYPGGSSIYQKDSSFYPGDSSIHQRDSSFYPGDTSIHQKDSSFCRRKLSREALRNAVGISKCLRASILFRTRPRRLCRGIAESYGRGRREGDAASRRLERTTLR